MEKHRAYNNIIEDKLQQLPCANVGNLWSGMHTILDQKMPQAERKRRFFGWLFAGKTMLICSTVLLLGTASIILNQSSSLNQSSQHRTVTNNQNKNNIPASVSEERSLKHADIINSNAEKNISNQTISKTPVNTFNSVEIKHQDYAEAVDGPITIATSLKRSFSTENSNKNKKEVSITSENQMASVATEFRTTTSYCSSVRNSSELNQVDLITNFESERPQVTEVTPRNHFAEKLKKEIDSNTQLRRGLIKRNDNRGIYVGVMAGLDLSSVRFNSFNSGSNTGFILGYSFNKNWSIETGCYWNKKNFTGDSGTFTLKNYTVQPGVKILSTKGDVRLYEVPLSVRYTILPYQHNLIITAGVSSYFMKWENYKYNYEYAGQSGYSFFSPQNTTNNWFSIANFSIGYSYKLGTIGSLRMEPYLKVPIRKIGFCNMPVVSTGLNIGFTRQLSRH